MIFVIANGGRYSSHEPVGLDAFKEEMATTCVTITGVDVKGKYMWWTLALEGDPDPWHMWCTYGMSGQWTLEDPGRHTVAAIGMAAPFQVVYFRDPRHFGTLKFVKGRETLAKKLATLGPDMLNDPPCAAEFYRALDRKSSKTLAEVLMDQSVVSGVGNYVKAEALWRARLSPHRLVNSLDRDEATRLRNAVVDVMQESYHRHGASIKTYRSPDGAEGSAQDFFKIYARDTDPAGHRVHREETRDGRTTHWCPQCQR